MCQAQCKMFCTLLWDESHMITPVFPGGWSVEHWSVKMLWGKKICNLTGLRSAEYFSALLKILNAQKLVMHTEIACSKGTFRVTLHGLFYYENFIWETFANWTHFEKHPYKTLCSRNFVPLLHIKKSRLRNLVTCLQSFSMWLC